jgi:hypothetical protein
MCSYGVYKKFRKIGMKQKIIFLKKKIQNGLLKQPVIFNSTNSQFFLQKFQGLVLGLDSLLDSWVRLIDCCV